MPVPVETAVRATVDANGRAVAYLSPDRARINWRITRLITSTSRPDKYATSLYVYLNFETPTRIVDSTSMADNDVSSCDILVRSGERLVAVWSNGYPGSICTLTVTGQVE